MEKATVLVVEDDPHLLGTLEAVLAQNNMFPLLAKDGSRGFSIFSQNRVDLALIDYRLADGYSGLELASRIRFQDSELPVILITGYTTENLIVEALRNRINDYFSKPFQIENLIESIQRLICLRKPSVPMALPLKTRNPPHQSQVSLLVGASPPIQKIKALIGRVAVTDTTVLISGQTGTGKELVAEAIHRSSSRAKGPFVAINCTAIPDTPLESELFGHERGAFTGADVPREGTLKLADAGTVFLDEIGDMSLLAQAKILRVLDKRLVQRIGGRREEPIDIRII